MSSWSTEWLLDKTHLLSTRLLRCAKLSVTSMPLPQVWTDWTVSSSKSSKWPDLGFGPGDRKSQWLCFLLQHFESNHQDLQQCSNKYSIISKNKVRNTDVIDRCSTKSLISNFAQCLVHASVDKQWSKDTPPPHSWIKRKEVRNTFVTLHSTPSSRIKASSGQAGPLYHSW